LKKLSISQLSDLTGFDRKTIAKRLEKLHPVAFEDKMSRKPKEFDSKEALRCLYLGHQDSSHSELKKRELKAKVELAEIKADREKGKLVDIKQVGYELGQVFSVIRQNFLALPSKAAQDLSHESKPKTIQEILSEMVNECLADLQKYADTQKRNSESTEKEHEASAEAESGGVGGHEPGAQSGSQCGPGTVENRAR